MTVSISTIQSKLSTLYLFLSQPVLIFFVIFPIQGVITTSKDLDREAPGLAVDADGRGVYTLMVEATDHGSPTQQTTATVIVNRFLKLFVISCTNGNVCNVDIS